MRRPVLKRGSESTWAVIAMLIIVLVSALVVLFWLRTSSNTATSASDEEQCRTSIVAQSLQAKITPGAPLDALRCATKYVTIDAKEAEKQKAAIANSMASCWSRFGAGTTKLFATETGTYCVICAKLDFKNPTKLTEFTPYLMETQRPGMSKTYYEYLFGVDPVAGRAKYLGSDVQGKDTLDTSRSQAVVYVATKQVSSWTGELIAGGVVIAGGIAVVGSGGTLLPIIAAIGGGSAGYIAGQYTIDDQYQATTVVWPYDDIGLLRCSRLEGKAGSLRFT